MGTSAYGGAILAASIDYFVERLSMIYWVRDRVTLKPAVAPPCWFSWFVFAAWPSFVVAGLVIQCAVTGRGTHHADSTFMDNKKT